MEAPEDAYDGNIQGAAWVNGPGPKVKEQESGTTAAKQDAEALEAVEGLGEREHLVEHRVSAKRCSRWRLVRSCLRRRRGCEGEEGSRRRRPRYRGKGGSLNTGQVPLYSVRVGMP